MTSLEFLLVGLVVVGVQGFAPSPIVWEGRLGRRFVLATRGLLNNGMIPNRASPSAQMLMIRDQSAMSSDEVPYFILKSDKTIALADSAMCIEARDGTVGIHSCTGGPNQLWNILRMGRGRKSQIQLKDHNACLAVDEGFGTEVAVRLRECDSNASESWMIEKLVPFPSATSFTHKAASGFSSRNAMIWLSVMAGIGAFSVSAVLRRWRKRARAIGAGQNAMPLIVERGTGPLTVEHGGVCLSMPSTVCAGEESQCEFVGRHGMVPSVMALNPTYMGHLNHARLHSPIMMSSSPEQTSSSDDGFATLGVAGLPLESTMKKFKAVPDQKLRYQSLLFLAKKLPAMDKALQIEENRVPGCQSVVFVHATRQEDATFTFEGTSDSELTKGLVALLVQGFAGCTNDQIQAVQPEFIQAMGLAQSLTPGRNNGFLNMFQLIKRKAASLEEASS